MESSHYQFMQLEPKEQIKLLKLEEWQQMDIPHGEVAVDYDTRPHLGVCFSRLTGFFQSQGL